MRHRPVLDRSATLVRRRPSLDFSLTGLIYCTIMMFMGLAAINTQVSLLFGVFGLMIGVLIISGVISRLVLRKLRITRMLPEQAEVGLPVILTYQFQNAKRFWPSVSTSIAELDGVEGFTKQPMSYMLHAAAGSTATVPTEVIPKRRGIHEFGRHQVTTSFPFGFIKRAFERSRRDTLLIFPPLATVDRRLMQMCRSAEKTGATVRPKRGGQDEFYGVKEHRRGENPRMIYWRRSTRTNVLVAKEMTQVAPPRLMLLVDTRLQGDSVEAFVLVERTIAMAASMASAAIRDGLLVGLVAWGGNWIAFPPERGKRHRVDLLAALAKLGKNNQHGAAELLDKGRSLIESDTTAVLFTPGKATLGLGDLARATLIVVSADAPAAKGWFQFNSGVDFQTCMPADQQPKLS